MVTGNAGLKTIPILRETKKTLYRLHPNEFGRVMVMPNLPNGLHEAEMWRNKGYKYSPQELNPQARLEKSPEGGIFLVPDGYKLDSKLETVTDPNTKESHQETVWHVIKSKESTPTAEGVEEAPLYVSEKPKRAKK